MERVLIFLCLFFSKSVLAQLTYSEYLEVKLAVEMAFDDLKRNEHDTLVINEPVAGQEDYWWNLDVVHASYSSTEKEGHSEHHIFLFGGFMRQQWMTKDSLALTACHELGHGLGGDPYKDSGSSTEGQADYYATDKCLKVVFNYLNTSEYAFDDYISDFCSRNSDDLFYCERAMESLKGDIAFFKSIGQNVKLDGHSNIIADFIDTSPRYYPDAQCRIDTMVHGIINHRRPKCWFPKGELRVK